jgi:hypothetical protein
MTKKCTYGHKIFQMTAKIFKWPKQTPTFTIPRSSKIYPNWDFWHVNIPSGHIGCNQTVFKICLCALAAWLSMCCYVRVVRLNLSRVHRGSFIFFLFWSCTYWISSKVKNILMTRPPSLIFALSDQ